MSFDADALRELRWQRLRRTVELCFAAHPFYSRRYRELGIDLAEIRSRKLSGSDM